MLENTSICFYGSGDWLYERLFHIKLQCELMRVKVTHQLCFSAAELRLQAQEGESALPITQPEKKERSTVSEAC